MFRTQSLLLSTVSAAALFASPALAQDAQPAGDQAEQQAADQAEAPEAPPAPEASTEAAIVVTGTRIRTPNLESALPVQSIGGEEFFETGNVSVGDSLAELPSIRSTFTQANSTRFLGTAGLNLIDLRGLGTVRTLVLVNGRRHVGGDVLSSGVSVDVNTIPTDLIERVDVVTGGNSAVYGSDAIAGVVNFILKEDYEGVLLRGQAGTSRYGDADSFFISGLFGKNFADGRGNVAVNVEYARRDQSYIADRSWARNVLTIVDSDVECDGTNAATCDPAVVNGSDGIADRILNPDFRSATYSNGGTVRIGGRDYLGNPVPYYCGNDPLGGQYNCTFNFGPDGRLRSQTGDRTGIGPNGQYIGGNGEGFFDKDQVQITPQLDRYSVNLVSHFEVSPAFVPFVEAKFSRTDSVGTGGSGPAFFSGGVLGDPLQFFSGTGNRERISLSNPYLDPTDSATIRDAILAAGVNNCNFRYLTATDITRLNNGTFRFCTQESMYGLGARTEEARRDTYRIVAGVKGDLGNNWNYEVSFNYGQLNETTKILGNLDIQRFLLAMDAVRDPNTGQIVCASQINPGRAFGYYPWFYNYFYGSDYPGADPNADARLANDVANCTPINPLGGQFTQAQRDYLLLDTVAKGKTKQLDLTAFISGDSSKWFELPGGPVGFVLGAEYRADDLYYHQDEQVTLGYTFYNAIPTFDAPKSKVKEAFGELRLPLVKDVPFLHELEVSAAARVSDYTLGTTGTVWAWNGNAIWSPFDGLRLRGNIAKAVRAPNQVELFSPFGQNYSLVADPCDVNRLSEGSQYRAANCAAAGIPANAQIQYASSLPFLSGGNVDLEAEVSRSLTLGGVFTPKFLPGFSFSADYYRIKVKNTIQGVSAQSILNACYDLPDLNNQYCSLFARDIGDGNTGNNGIPYGVVPNSLQVTPLNYAKLVARGIDFEAAYRHTFAGIGKLNTRLNWTHVLELTNYVDPTNPQFGNRILSELGDPKDAFNWNTSLETGPVKIGYQMRYIGKMTTSNYEDYFSFQGRPPQNEDFADKKWYPSKVYHDVRIGVDIAKRFNWYAGVDNLTDTKPPYALSGIGGGSAIYDSIGRFFYTGFSAKF